MYNYAFVVLKTNFNLSLSLHEIGHPKFSILFPLSYSNGFENVHIQYLENFGQ